MKNNVVLISASTLLLLLVGFFFSSCKKKEEVADSNTPSRGRIVFVDKDSKKEIPVTDFNIKVKSLNANKSVENDLKISEKAPLKSFKDFKSGVELLIVKEKGLNEVEISITAGHKKGLYPEYKNNIIFDLNSGCGHPFSGIRKVTFSNKLDGLLSKITDCTRFVDIVVYLQKNKK